MDLCRLYSQQSQALTDLGRLLTFLDQGNFQKLVLSCGLVFFLKLTIGWHLAWLANSPLFWASIAVIKGLYLQQGKIHVRLVLWFSNINLQVDTIFRFQFISSQVWDTFVHFTIQLRSAILLDDTHLLWPILVADIAYTYCCRLATTHPIRFGSFWCSKINLSFLFCHWCNNRYPFCSAFIIPFHQFKAAST